MIRFHTANAVNVSSTEYNQGSSGTQNDPSYATYFVSHDSAAVSYLDYCHNGTIGLASNKVQNSPSRAEIFIGDISCGDSNRRKKFYYLYVNCSVNPGTFENFFVHYSVDKGVTWHTGVNESSTATPSSNSLESGENKINIRSSGKSILIQLGNKALLTSDLTYNCQISDLSLVFRERTVK